jgi:spore maturation protein CgeB
MRISIVCRSLLSDGGRGSTHFLRGIAGELVRLGHRVRVHETLAAGGEEPSVADAELESLDEVLRVHSTLDLRRAGPRGFDLAAALEATDLVLVHERTAPAIVRAIGRARTHGGRFRLLYHDTHHRSVTEPDEVEASGLSAYDGVLAAGEAACEAHRRRGWGRRVWSWHEAADANLFRPRPRTRNDGDLVWIGNWGDDGRTRELRQFLIGPIRSLGLRARTHGARYPERLLDELAALGVAHGGWLPNVRVPLVFARHRVTVHVPRRTFVEALPGVPSIRLFEALACGIPLVCSPWNDVEGLFRPGTDFLVACDGAQMAKHLRAILADDGLASSLARSGLERIRTRHTCRHRALELEAIARELGILAPPETTLTIPSLRVLGGAEARG